jgi:hypothetical protein
MQPEMKSNWGKAEEPFRRIIKTRAQLRAEMQGKNQKRLKDRSEESGERAKDQEASDQLVRKVTMLMEDKPEARFEVLNKFLKTRMGMTVAFQPEQAPLAPEKEVKPTEEMVTPASSSMPPTVKESEVVPPGIDSKRRKTPPRESVQTITSSVKTETAPRTSPKQEEVLMDQLMKRFLLKKAVIRQLIQQEGMKKRDKIPDFERDRFRATHAMADRQGKTVKLSEAAELNIDHLNHVASQVRETKIYDEPDFRELMELVVDAQATVYKVRTEDLASKNRVIVKKPNERNQRIRFRMPVLQEFHETMRQLNEHLDAVEQNRDFDFQAVRADLRQEFLASMNQDNLIVEADRFEEEFRKRKAEFIQKNLRSYLDSCMRLAEVFDKFDQLSESLTMLEENNSLNRRLIFHREYDPVAPLIEANGVELLKNFLEAFPGKPDKESER